MNYLLKLRNFSLYISDQSGSRIHPEDSNKTCISFVREQSAEARKKEKEKTSGETEEKKEI